MYLDHNRMTSLSEPLIASFKRFVPTLRCLNLCHNLLPALPAVLGTLTALTTLDVSHNKIREWPLCVSKLEQLTVLNLSHNEMELISPDSNLQVLTKLTTLILARNRFVSICALELLN
jgi:internalin A